MKKLATLLLAAGLVFGVTAGANAIDFKAKGQWIMSFDYGQNGGFVGKFNNKTPTGWGRSNEDDFEARQRVRLQLDAVASESLSGTVYFEIGDQIWGKANTNSGGAMGGAIGADGIVVELKNAYIDWMIPETDVKVRMGIQNITTPAYASGNSVLNDDVAGIVVSAPINENVGVTAFWARPYNDNYVDGDNPYRNSYLDNMDFGGLLIPLTFDGIKLTPWGMYGAIGPNTFSKNNEQFVNFPGAGSGYVQSGLFPVGGSRHKDFSPKNKTISDYGQAWWAGISSDITIWDPVRVAFDFEYGSVTWEDNGSLDRSGWFATLLLEYKMDWGIPGIYGWYGSGDDDNPANGSERLPTLDGNNTNKYSNFAFDGDPYIARDAVVGHSMAGTWGVGARLKDMSFIEDLTHTLRVNFMGGTNSPTMAKKMSLAGIWANGDNLDTGGRMAMGVEGLYLTTEDHALEVGLSNYYKMYENFTIALEADYVALWLDTSKSVWGARHRLPGGHIPDTKDAWNINASFVYQF